MFTIRFNTCRRMLTPGEMDKHLLRLSVLRAKIDGNLLTRFKVIAETRGLLFEDTVYVC